MAILKRPVAITGIAKHSPAGGSTNRDYVLNTKHVIAQKNAFHPNTIVPTRRIRFK